MQCEVRWSNETGGGLVKPYPHHISKYGQQSAWKDKIMDDEARRERRRRQRQKMLNCCKKFAAFLFSHIGLAAMVVAYSIMGGFLFMALEAPYEAKEKIRIRGERDDAIERILNEASQMKLDDAAVVGNFTAKVRTILLAYQAEVVSAVKDSGWDGNDDTDVRALQWSFAGALLYAVTVITTIGKSLYLIWA
ncbi:hypothetical protein LSH36_3g14021 [Paralvinella palmiformis]|uniref:Uncharacterized protein n=1 Tax=Paralvinella palmiformis TaxID=53620 RepID=A0AAD9KFH6_9ANNE|nr:hypothetical protein LSH36_3g14021 [Paralvinella palmiformis]